MISRNEPGYMQAYRIRTGRQYSMALPISLLQQILAGNDGRESLLRHLGPDICKAISSAPKARSGATA